MGNCNSGFASNSRNINRRGSKPRDKSITGYLRKYAEKKRVEDGRKWGEWLAEQLFTLAADNDMTAIKYIIDRLDGKAIETVKQTTDLNLNSPVVILPQENSLFEEYNDGQNGNGNNDEKP
jgi:hypothetical protein